MQERFRNPDDPLRFFVGNPKTGQFGLNLAAEGLNACTMIYYTNDFSLEGRAQSEKRIHRIGQTQSVTYIDLVAEKTVDEKILEVLKRKQHLSDVIVDGGWRALLEDSEREE